MHTVNSILINSNLFSFNKNFVVLPIDYVPVYGSLKPTDTDPCPLESRMRYLPVLDKRGADGLPINDKELPPCSLEQLDTRLQNWRLGTMKWGDPRIEGYFCDNMVREFKDDFKQSDGSTITSSQQFCELYRRGPNDRKMRRMVYYALNTLWGSNNQWAINLEAEYTKMLKMKFGKKTSSGKMPSRPTSGNCFASIFVRKKGHIVEKIRNTGKRCYKEGLYHRNEKPSRQQGSVRNGIPKMVKQVVATEDKHGFRGLLGLCEGHPLLLEVPKTPTKMKNQQDEETPQAESHSAASSLTAPSPACGNEVQDFLVKNSKNITNLQDLLGVLLADSVITGMDAGSRAAAENLVGSPFTAGGSLQEVTAQNDGIIAGYFPDFSSEKVRLHIAVAESLKVEADPLTFCAFKMPEISITDEESLQDEHTTRFPCQHDRESLKMWDDGGYFKDPYLSKNPLWPTNCLHCSIKFTGKPASQVEKGKEHKVCNRSPILMCRNAANSAHKCNYAFCAEACFTAMNTKKRKPESGNNGDMQLEDDGTSDLRKKRFKPKKADAFFV